MRNRGSTLLHTPSAKRRRLIGAALATMCCAGPPRATRAQPRASADRRRPLRLGLVPYLTARQMVTVFEPLRAHLQAELGRRVVSFTAASLPAMAENTRRGDYDIAFMPVHFMRLAAQSWNCTIVARTTATTRIVLAGRPGASIVVPDGLRGGRIVSLDEYAITSMVMLDWLHEHGLEPGRDLEVEFIVAATSVLLALQRPEVTALAIIEAILTDVAPELAVTVQVLAPLRSVPPPGYVVGNQLGAAERERIGAALLSFGGASDRAGSLSRAPLEATTLADTDSVERYSAQLRALLARDRRG